MKHHRITAIIVLALGFCTALWAQDEPRFALVIGNANYTGIPSLRNPINDATDIATALDQLRFETSVLTDSDLRSMREAVRSLGTKLSAEPGAIGVFYFAGHGVQSDGENYLIPIGADVQTENDLRYEALSANYVLDYLNDSGASFNMIILDACRDNPFAEFRSAGRGLAVVEAPQGSIVLYATGAGAVAADGEGRNGIFTQSLLSHIGAEGITVTEMVRRVMQDVSANTAGRQVPAFYSNYFGQFSFAAGAQSTSVPARPAPAPSLQAAVGEIQITVQTGGQLMLDGESLGELADGQSATLRDVPTGRRTLLMDYGGEQETVTVTVAADARATVRFDYERLTAGEIQVTVRTGGRLLLDGEYQRQLADGQSATLRDVPAGSRTLVMDYGDEQETVTVTVAADTLVSARFDYERPPVGEIEVRETPGSLETVFVEGGTFRMGSPSDGEDDERSVHSVTLDSFWMTTTEVTFAQYDEFARATSRNVPDDERLSHNTPPAINVKWSGEGPPTYRLSEAEPERAPASPAPAALASSFPDDEGWGRESRPVINVSWYDAVAYANWLSGQDGLTPAYRINGTTVTWNHSANGWRLPTEAEWEYAARGGTEARETTYAGSNSAGAVAWYRENRGSGTHPVAEKQPNELGLYDMSGNVWEWCWDWYGDYSSGSQTNPAGPVSGSDRVLRGGSWSNGAPGVRVAYRINSYPGLRYSILGFRLVAPAVQ